MSRTRGKTNLRRLAKDGETSIVKVMTKNATGQAVDTIQDPSERLIATIGVATNEPRFYPVEEYAQTVGYTYDASDFDVQAQEIIKTAIEVAESDNPRDLLAIAHWTRTEMRMRTIPQVLLAVAAECNETKQFVRQYSPRIIQRADELKQTFIAYRHLFGHQKSLPNSFKRGLADTFTKFKEYQFLKYEGRGRPFFSDVLKMIDRKKDWPLEKNLDHYLKTGEVLDDTKIPVIAARKQLSKCETFDEEAKKLAVTSRANWEVVLSQFGNTKEVWEHLINTEQLGYMAMLRNLRNMLQADVGYEVLDSVTKRLVSGATTSKQLPYRFKVALQMLDALDDKVNAHKVEAIKIALNQAVQEIANLIPQLPGSSLIVADTSGSMTHPVSERSKATRINVASMLGALLYNRSTNASVIGAFADKFEIAKGVAGKGILDVADTVERINVGWGTNAEDILRWALREKKKFDRIVIFSDMETYGGTARYAFGYRPSESDRRPLKDLIKEYREKINPQCKLHTFDLAGHGRSVTAQDDTLTNLVSGYSEKLLDTILSFEGLIVDPDTKEVIDANKGIFTLEYIRENF